MKAMIIQKYGKNPLLLADIPTPSVGDYDVLAEIRMKLSIIRTTIFTAKEAKTER